MSTIEARPNKPPINFTLSAHNEEDKTISNVLDFSAHVRQYCRDNPNSRVLIVIEDGAQSIEGSQHILDQTSLGIPLSSTFYSPNLEKKKRRWSKSQVRIAPKPMPDRFTATVDMELDSLIAENAGRVGVLSEGSDKQQIVQTKLTDSASRIFNKNLALLLANNQVDVALALFKKSTIEWSTNIAARDVNLHSLMEEAISKFKPDEVFVLFGTMHTKLSHLLNKNGFPITRSFADRSGSEFCFSPQQILERRINFKTGYKPSETEWIKGFILELVYSRLVYLLDDKQAAAKGLNGVIQNLSDNAALDYFQILKQEGYSAFVNRITEIFPK